MKKWMFTVAILLLVTVMIVGLTACGSGEELKFGKELLKVDTQLIAMQQVHNNRGDIAIVSSIMANYYMYSVQYGTDLIIVPGQVLADERLGIAARKGALDTIAKVNEALTYIANLQSTAEGARQGESLMDEIAANYGIGGEVCLSGKESFVTYDEIMSAENANIYGETQAKGDWAKIAAKGKLVIGFSIFAPVASEDKNGNLVGFDIDLAKAAGEYLGITVDFRKIVPGNRELELTSGNIDLVWNGLPITEKLSTSLEISLPYLNNTQVMVVRKSDLYKYATEEAWSVNSAQALVVVERGSSAHACVLKNG